MVIWIPWAIRDRSTSSPPKTAIPIAAPTCPVVLESPEVTPAYRLSAAEIKTEIDIGLLGPAPAQISLRAGSRASRLQPGLRVAFIIRDTLAEYRNLL